MLKRRKNLLKFSVRHEVDVWGRLIRKNFRYKKIQYFLSLLKAYINKRKKRQFNFDLMTRTWTKNPLKKKEVKKFNLKFDIFAFKKKKISGETNIKYKKRFVKRKRGEKFMYQTDLKIIKRRYVKRTFSRTFFLLRRKLTKFYCNIKKHQFRRYAKSKTYPLRYKYGKSFMFKRYLESEYYGNIAFLSILEHRLDVILFRSNFAISMQQARQFINHKHVLVNNRVVNSCNFQVKNFDIVSLKPKIEILVRRLLLKNLKRKKVLAYPPKYLAVDYRLMFALINKTPTFKEIPFCFSINPKLLLGFSQYY